MTRRITRTLTQLLALLLTIFLLLFLADTRYRLLPDSVHNHLPLHHAGSVVTDISIAFCSSANPFSTCRLDSEKWQRIEKDLYLNSGWLSSAWLHVQRRKEEELGADERVVVDVRIGGRELGPLLEAEDEGKTGEAWESRPGNIWILRSSRRHASDSEKVVTALDVLFGADAVDPRPGWELSRTPLALDGGGLHEARLTVRHGQPHTHSTSTFTGAEKDPPTPRVGKDGRFKILQISDAHLSTGIGTCRDAIGTNNEPSPKDCEADPRTLDFLENVLDTEKPDLVILSGDQVEGPQALDTQTALFKITAPLITRQVPYAAIFGNHDDEGPLSLSRARQMDILTTLPFSLSQAGPEDLPGVGNYYLEILAPSPSQHSAITVYLLDTHGLTPDEKKWKGYDWIKQSQIDWFRATAQSLRGRNKKYTHIHLDLAFIHIPLPEFAMVERDKVVGGEWRESVTAPGYNSHFYNALIEEGIVAVGAGHDHVNDYCGLPGGGKEPSSPSHSSSSQQHKGPWMCYAGASGFGGYAGYGGFHRRVRVWEVDTNAGKVMTWKRVECCSERERGERVDEVLLVEGGRVVGG